MGIGNKVEKSLKLGKNEGGEFDRFFMFVEPTYAVYKELGNYSESDCQTQATSTNTYASQYYLHPLPTTIQ